MVNFLMITSFVSPVFADGTGKNTTNSVDYLSILGNFLLIVGALALIVVVARILKERRGK